MKVRSETVQIRALAREIGVSPRRRTLQYVEQRNADFSCQSAEMCQSKRTFMNNPGQGVFAPRLGRSTTIWRLVESWDVAQSQPCFDPIDEDFAFRDHEPYAEHAKIGATDPAWQNLAGILFCGDPDRRLVQ